MGNLMSNACDGHNPTYEYKIQEGKPVLMKKDDAQYDFEELRYHCPEEAALDIPQTAKKC